MRSSRIAALKGSDRDNTRTKDGVTSVLSRGDGLIRAIESCYSHAIRRLYLPVNIQCALRLVIISLYVVAPCDSLRQSISLCEYVLRRPTTLGARVRILSLGKTSIT
jgi:hypothetical protein